MSGEFFADLMNQMTDVAVVMLVLFVVFMAAVLLLVIIRRGDSDSRWIQYVSISFATFAVLISCLALLFWPRVRVLHFDGMVPYLIAAAVAVVVGGLVGWLLSRHFTDTNRGR